MILRYANFAVPPLGLPVEPEDGPGPVGLSAQATGDAPSRLSEDDGDAPRDWRITDEQKALALQTFENGASISAAARASGLGMGTAHALLKPVAIALGRHLATWNQMTTEDVEEARGLRAQGWSYTRLGERYGVTRQAVTRRLRLAAS